MFTIMHDNLNICGIYMGQLLLFAIVCMNKNVRLLIIQMQRPFNLYTYNKILGSQRTLYALLANQIVMQWKLGFISNMVQNWKSYKSWFYNSVPELIDIKYHHSSFYPFFVL